MDKNSFWGITIGGRLYCFHTKDGAERFKTYCAHDRGLTGPAPIFAYTTQDFWELRENAEMTNKLIRMGYELDRGTQTALKQF